MRFSIFIFFSIFLFSCDIFLTRVAEEPLTNLTSNPPATTPEQLIENLKTSISNKDPQEYLVFFSDTINSTFQFNFYPEQKLFLQFPSIFANWNSINEQQYFTNLKTKITGTPNLIFENSNLTKFQSDSAIFVTDYNLFFPHNDNNISKTFKGRSHFYFATTKNKTWVCYRWDDFELSKDSSWSLCKGYFSK